ncbi:MAG: LOG family protein [Thermoprotei archaeon]
MISVGVAAHSEGSNKELARRFIKKLPDNVRIILGGYWGLMRDVADAAAERGMQVVFILPNNPKEMPPRNKFFIPIDTGLDFKARSTILVRSSDILVTLGGEIGTIIELFMAYSYGKPVIVLRNSGFSTDKLERAFGSSFDNRLMASIIYVDTPEELAEKALMIINKINY